MMADTTEDMQPAANPAKPPKPRWKASQGSGLGIEAMGDLSGLLGGATPTSDGAPLPANTAGEIALELIDEDPAQPRTHFDEGSLTELADTIKLRGVKTPISVRPNPDSEGRFIINHGARRYRASALAGKLAIPAFIDADYSETDQVIENLQRDGLTSREIADFIGRELAKGVKQNAIAKNLGKSKTFVSHHVTLLDLPTAIAEAFVSGRVGDVTLVNELVGLHNRFGEDIAEWLSNKDQDITRRTVRVLRDQLENPIDNDDETLSPDELDAGAEPKVAKEPRGEQEEDTTKLRKAIVTVSHDGRYGRLLLNKRPSREGDAWIKYNDDGYEFEANLETVTLVSVIEG